MCDVGVTLISLCAGAADRRLRAQLIAPADVVSERIGQNILVNLL